MYGIWATKWYSWKQESYFQEKHEHVGILKNHITVTNKDYKTMETTINKRLSRGARGVMVIIAGYGHGDTSSNPRPDWLHFT